VNAVDVSACYRQLGFDDTPFAITPDTDIFFPGSRHMSALRNMEYGLASGGFTLLTGEVGLGKTLICRKVLKQSPAGVRTAYIFNPPPTNDDLVRAIHHDLTGEALAAGSHTDNLRRMHDTLLTLAAGGEKVAVILDEAHLLSHESLEGLRLLSNLETEKEKLIYLILVGQPELERTLASKRQRPLAQRISVRAKLTPFGAGDTVRYIGYRLEQTRRFGHVSFSLPAMLAAHYYSGGAPRRINQICDRALLGAYAREDETVGAAAVMRAAREVTGAAA
jgi:general secretion pathway protein A